MFTATGLLKSAIDACIYRKRLERFASFYMIQCFVMVDRVSPPRGWKWAMHAVQMLKHGWKNGLSREGNKATGGPGDSVVHQ